MGTFCTYPAGPVACDRRGSKVSRPAPSAARTWSSTLAGPWRSPPGPVGREACADGYSDLHRPFWSTPPGGAGTQDAPFECRAAARRTAPAGTVRPDALRCRHASAHVRGGAGDATHRRDGQPPVADARPDTDPAPRHRRARIPPTGLGGDQAETGGDLRVGVQGGVPRLRQPGRPGQRVGHATEPDEELRVHAPRHGPRGDRRGGGRRSRGGGTRAGGPGRPQPVAHLRDPGGVARLSGLRGGRPEPVPLVREGPVRPRHPHRHVLPMSPGGSPTSCRPTTRCSSRCRTT